MSTLTPPNLSNEKYDKLYEVPTLLYLLHQRSSPICHILPGSCGIIPLPIPTPLPIFLLLIPLLILLILLTFHQICQHPRQFCHTSLFKKLMPMLLMMPPFLFGLFLKRQNFLPHISLYPPHLTMTYIPPYL